MARTTRKRRNTGNAISRILVATDFSPDAAEAVETASGFARDLGGEIVVIHVDEPLLELTHSNEHARRRQLSIAQLERVTRSLAAQGLDARSSLRIGEPAREIVGAATELGASLLVIGTRGRSAAVAALLGGVAYEVIRKAPCPVVTVHATHATPRRSGEQPGTSPPARRRRSRARRTPTVRRPRARRR